MRRWPLPVFLVTLLVSNASPARASVPAQGLLHDALGAATLVVIPPGASGARRLEVHNLGSSGQDGVSIACPATTGISLRLGRPAVNTALTTGRFSELKGLVAGTTSRLAALTETLIGSSISLVCDVPGVTECQVDVWNGNALVYSARRPLSAVVNLNPSGAPIAIDEPGVQLAFTEENREHHVMVVGMERPSAVSLTVGGFTTPATRVTFTCETPLAQTRASECRVTGTSDGTGVCALELTQEGVVDEKPNLPGTPTPHGLLLWAGSGCSLASAGPAGGFTITPDGTGEPEQVTFKGLPPGTPYIFGGSGRMQWGMLPADMNGATPSTMSLAMTCSADDGSGTPSTAIETLDWTMASAGKMIWSPKSNVASEEFHCEGYYRGALVVTISGNNFSSFSTTQSPRGVQVLIRDGECCPSCRFAPGTLAFVNGTGHDLDSLVWRYRATAGTPDLPKLDITQCVLAVSSVSTLHVNGPTGASSSAYARAGGRGVSGGKGAIVQPVPGGVERTIHVRNLGSSGEDGADITAKKGLNAVNVRLVEPDPGDLSSVRPAALVCRAMPCDDGTCAALGELDITGMDTPSGAHQIAVRPPLGSNYPVFLSVAGHVVEALDADTDHDGAVDVTALGGSTVSVSNIACRVDAPTVLTWTVAFASPVSITISGQNFSTTSMRFYQNRGGGAGGGGGGALKVIHLWGLPPGTPFATSVGVCDFTIGEPEIPIDGLAIGDPGVNGNLAGWPVTPTWATVSGDEDCDTGPDDLVTLTNVPNHVISVSEPLLTTEDMSGVARGFVSMGHYGDPTGGTAAKNATLEVSGNPGGSVSSNILGLVTSFPAGGGPVTLECTCEGTLPALECTAYAGGVPQSTFAYAGPFTSDNAPGVVAIAADVDGDGQRHLHGGGLPPGNTIHVLGSTVPCDSFVVRSVGAPPVTSVGRFRARMSSAGVVQAVNVRVAAIPRVTPTTGVPQSPGAHATFALSRPEPNPLRTSTMLRFSLPAASLVRAEVLDVGGRVVVELQNGPLAAGEHSVRWDGRTADGAEAAPGLYFVRIRRAGGDALTARVTRLK